jgi:hypothetical protein
MMEDISDAFFKRCCRTHSSGRIVGMQLGGTIVSFDTASFLGRTRQGRASVSVGS